MYVLLHNGYFVGKLDSGLGFVKDPASAMEFSTVEEAREHMNTTFISEAYVLRVEPIFSDHMTVDEAAKARGLKVFDVALPQEWVDAMNQRGMDVRGHFVWCYDGPGIFGYPHPITYEGEVMAGVVASSI